nr:MAG TPA: hypothetical protein [Caudoviricetes sp.]
MTDLCRFVTEKCRFVTDLCTEKAGNLCYTNTIEN